jgi:hypothetical protein
MLETKKLIKIQNWALVGYSASSYAAPEQAVMVLVGEVKGHPTKGDGIIRSGEVIWFSSASGFAETRNTMYDLGEPNKAWVELLRQQGKVIDDYHIEKRK